MSENTPKTRIILTIFETGSSVNFRSWKTAKSHGKGHGKSWNLKNFKSTNPDRPSCSVCDKTEPFKIYDATVTKTSFKIASSGLLLFFVIMSACQTSKN